MTESYGCPDVCLLARSKQFANFKVQLVTTAVAGVKGGAPLSLVPWKATFGPKTGTQWSINNSGGSGGGGGGGGSSSSRNAARAKPNIRPQAYVASGELFRMGSTHSGLQLPFGKICIRRKRPRY